MKQMIIGTFILIMILTLTSCKKEQENECEIYRIEYEQSLETYEDAKLIYDDNTNYGKSQIAYYEMLKTKSKQEYQKCLYNL